MKYLETLLLCIVVCVSAAGQDINPTLYKPNQIIEDINFLLENMNKIHPNFNQCFSDSSFTAKIDSIKDAIHDPMTKHQFFKLMQPFIAIDSHTSLRFDGKIVPEIEAPLFPFKIILFENQMVVKENLSSNKNIKKGAIIESINGLQTSIVIENLSKYVPHDGSRIRTQKIADEFHNFYRLLYGNFPEFRLVISDQGKKEKVRVSGTKFESFVSESRPQFEFRSLEDSVAYFYIGHFRKPDYFMNTIDSIFTLLQKKNIEYLIIDKRSGGGFADLADSLLSYLTDRPYHPIEKKAVKISFANEDYISENKSKGIIKDGYLILEYPMNQPVKRQNMFRGKTYVLVNHGSSSAATYFASAVKCNELGILVGEEAPQPLISNGDLIRFRLPNTKLMCYSSMSTYYLPCAENRDDSVIPDFEVKYSVEDLLNGQDRCLEYTLDLIDKEE